MIPSHPKYMKLLSSYSVPYERVQKLREDIGIKFEKMDFVFIDLPPQMYGIVKPLSKAADFIITPVSKTYFAITALQYLIEDMKTMPPTEWPIFLGAVLVRFRSNERAAIPEYREKVKKAVEEAYRLCGIKWELEGSGISPAFEAVLYNNPILARVRALPFDTLGNPYVVRVVRGEFKRAEKVLQIADALAKEFIERIGIALKLVSRR
jgi:cellulose biosynthesis protein BcsQ